MDTPSTRAYAVKVELDPTREQAKDLFALCEIRRWMYNDKVASYGRDHSTPSWARPPWLGAEPSALQNPVDKAYRATWAVCKRDGSRPRFLGRHHKPRFSFQRKNIWPRGIHVSIRDGAEDLWPALERAVRFKEDFEQITARVGAGRLERATISRDVDRWYCSLSVLDAPIPPCTATVEWVGIDANSAAHVGYVLSDGTRYPLPDELLRADARVGELQRELSKYANRCRRAEERLRGTAVNRKWMPKSNSYRAVREVLSKANRKVRRIRENWLHTITTAIVRKYKNIAIEDLRVRNMTASAKGTIENPGKNVRQKAGLNRSIQRASFAEFRRQLEYKAGWYGCHVWAIDPAYTSRDCSVCGETNPKAQEYRAFSCGCGHTQDRDDNAAANILSRGQALRAARAGLEVELDQPAAKPRRPLVSRADAKERSGAKEARASARKNGDRSRRGDRAKSAGAKRPGDGRSAS